MPRINLKEYAGNPKRDVKRMVDDYRRKEEILNRRYRDQLPNDNELLQEFSLLVEQLDEIAKKLRASQDYPESIKILQQKILSRGEVSLAEITQELMEDLQNEGLLETYIVRWKDQG
jgi:hypothetical protein